MQLGTRNTLNSMATAIVLPAVERTALMRLDVSGLGSETLDFGEEADGCQSN